MPYTKSIEKLKKPTKSLSDLVPDTPRSDPEFFNRCVDALGGVETLRRCVPFSDAALVAGYQKDEHFNESPTPLRQWEMASGVAVARNSRTGQTTAMTVQAPIWLVLEKHGVNSISQSEGVCLLKAVARRVAIHKIQQEKEGT